MSDRHRDTFFNKIEIQNVYDIKYRPPNNIRYNNAFNDSSNKNLITSETLQNNIVPKERPG